MKKTNNLKKKITHFRSKIRSRHPSHRVLRTELALLPVKSVIRLGSTTELQDTVAKGGNRIEINTVESIKNSMDKLRMKKCFTQGAVKTADWYTTSNGIGFNGDSIQPAISVEQLSYPLVAKHRFGSRGNGNTLLKTQAELEAWLRGKTLENYIFEKFYSYDREYRLHVTKEGCFYTCRKRLKLDTPEENKWYRNDSNSVWIVRDNEAFDIPVNWNTIEEHCVKALNSVGLDFGACDVRVQATKDGKGRVRPEPDFIVVEINSAPSFGDITTQKYLEILPKLIISKKQ